MLIAVVLGALGYRGLHPRVGVRVRYNFVKEDSDIYNAISGGESIETVRKLVEKKPGLVRSYRFHGQSPLILAAEHQRSDLVSLFLDMGADVDSVFEDEGKINDTTALHIAASNNDIKTIEVLLKHNANTNLRDRYGRTPLDIAVGFSHTAAADALNPKKSPQ